MPRVGPWVRSHLCSLPLLLLSLAPLSPFVACSSQEEAPAGVPGTEGRERWVVTFGGVEPDVAEYRALLTSNAEEADAYADRMRKKLQKDHAAFASSLQAVNGRIVDMWWMSNAATVEVAPHAVPTLRGAPGVASIVPDVALGN